MNYAAHYDRLIERARGRRLDGYRERHHVVPKCMGGGNEPSNIVELTGEEHYVAHQLLAKMHPSTKGLAYAAMKMAKKATGRRAYAWLRKRSADAGHSPEALAKITASKVGKKRGTFSAEWRAKLSASGSGRKFSDEHRRKIGEAGRGNKRWLGKKHSAETREKMSLSRLNNPNVRGNSLSGEHRLKIAASLIGNTNKRGSKSSDATRAKISASLFGNSRARRPTNSCPPVGVSQ